MSLIGQSLPHNWPGWKGKCNGKARPEAKYCHCCGRGVMVKVIDESYNSADIKVIKPLPKPPQPVPIDNCEVLTLRTHDITKARLPKENSFGRSLKLFGRILLGVGNGKRKTLH